MPKQNFGEPRVSGNGGAMPSAAITQITDITEFLDAVIPGSDLVHVFDRSAPDNGKEVARQDVEGAIARFNAPCVSLDNAEGNLLTVALKAHEDRSVENISMRMTGPNNTTICVYYLADPVHREDLAEGVFIDALPFPGEGWKAEVLDNDFFYQIDGNQIACVEQDGQEAAPERLNDAILIGTDCPEFEALMVREATFLTGKQFPDKPHKSTQAGQWKPITLPMAQHIVGFAGMPNTPEYGLSRHPVGKSKDGHCFVFGSSIGGQRKAKAMDTMYAIGLDIDSGASLETVRDRVLEMGVAAAIYTLWNHKKRGLTLKRDDVLKKLEIDRDPTLEQVQTYLREHGKNRFEEAFIQAVEIAEQKVQEEDGVKIILDTPEIDKFRVVFFLADPVKLIELAERHDDALALWEDKITGLAQKHLGVHFDTSCTDPSRLFYTPRHAKGSKVWQSIIIRGKPLRFEDIEPMRKSLYTRNRDVNPFVEADDQHGEKVPQVILPSGNSLNKWHSKVGKDRFLIADMLEAECPDKIRPGVGKQGSVHTECPFEHLHSKEGGTATMATNCIDSPNGYWTWFCHHDSCQDTHKLEFLGEAIREGWFPEDVLDDYTYLLPAEDDEDDPTEYTQPAPSSDGEARAAPEPKDALELVKKYDINSSDEDIRKFFKRLIKRGTDLAKQRAVIDALTKSTALGKRDLNKMWSKVEKDIRRDEDRSPEDETIKDVDSDLDVLVNHAKAGIVDANNKEAQFFHFIDAPAYVRPDASGKHKIEAITTQRAMRAKVDDMARFGARRGDSDAPLKHVLPPPDVADKVLFGDLSFLPPLKSVAASPFFANDGTLIAEDGYHKGTATLLRRPSGFDMPEVSMVPSKAEVHEAKRLLVEDVYGDFPVSGVSRATLVAEALGEETMTDAEAAGLAHLVAATLLPFCRNMIDGPTPGHLINKPAPGTGASLLVDTMSIITSGAPTPAQSLPTNKEEVGKTLTAVLMAGSPIVFFDNINHSVDTGELASAMTAPTYGARILGVSNMVETDVRCMWLFTGNKVTMSGELVRRQVLIPLDAGLDPTARSEWRHKDLRGWVRQNRGRLVWACLTLVQNWIAQGKKPADKELPSYDRWSATMGGILRDAGFRGFLANSAMLQDSVKKHQEEGVRDLLNLIANLPDGAILRLGGWTKPKDAGKDAPVVSIMHLLNRDQEDNPRLPDALKVKDDDATIIIPRWGCHPVDEVYKTSNKLGAEWRALADQPQQGYDEAAEGMVPLRFEERTDEKGKPFWVLRKE